MSSSEEEFEDAPIGKLKKANNGRSKKTVVKENDEDFIADSPPPKARAKRKRGSNGKTRRNVTTEDSDSENDFQPKKKKKAAIGKAVVKNEESDEDFIADSPPPKARAKRKGGSNGKKSSTTKRKVKMEELDSEDDFQPKKKKKAANGMVKKEKVKKLKKLEKTDRMVRAMQSFLWWDAPEPPEGCQWSTMEHAGPSFTENYEPHGVKMKYDGKEVDLNPLEEEAATFFAGMDPDGMHLGNPKTAPIFAKNFFTDFKAILNKRHGIKVFKKCDFEPIRSHLNEQKIIKKAKSDAEKKANKEERNESLFKFGYCLVDGHIEKVGNYNIEPPGTFRGRGEHPKMGRLKSRVFPEQVSVNVSECAAVPSCSVPGHAWGELRHDPQVQWLGQWKENINGQTKYMQLAAQSSFKGKSDRLKYNKAALLCDNIDKIRASYKKKLKAKSHQTRQLATAMWVIDRLALRVGGEKDTDEEADTVGCCSLRVEHLHFDPNNEGGDCKEIELEFLGKDSMLFKQTIDFGADLYTANNGMGEQVFDNFKLFCKKKKKSEEVFNSLTPTILNAHLKEIMEGLTAKVFRTYNASKTLQDELRATEKVGSWGRLTAVEKVTEYNNANRQVAILCNHQRSVSKAQNVQLSNLEDKIAILKKQKKMLKSILKALTTGEESKIAKIPTKKDEKKMLEKVSEDIAAAKKLKDTAKSNEEKIAATEADEMAKQKKRDLAAKKFKQAHLWDKVPTEDQVKKKIINWTQKIAKMEMDLKHKDDNKEVSLGTSKINYMDPRITVAWCKRNDVPIEKVFSKTLRDKFNWAMAVPSDWEFNGSVGT